LAKIIHDAVHGSMRLEGLPLELVKTPEFQRLRYIKQLGLAYLVYPGANHTRFEHSLGTWYLAMRLSQELNLEDEGLLFQVAAMLHDIGHGPFSHTFEGIYRSYAREHDHMHLGREIILGKIDISGMGSFIPDILRGHGLKPKEVADLIFGRHVKRYLGEALHGDVDVDQLDYLVRDSHYTGVAHGIIDLERLLKVMRIYNGELVVEEKGVEAVEGMMVARALMYSSVYFHHTVKIAEGMLTRALEFALDEGNLQDFWRMTDCRVLVEMEDLGGPSSELVKLVQYRKLYKAAVLAGPEDLSSEEKRELLKAYRDIERRQELEGELASAVGAKDWEVVLEFSTAELMVSEPRLKATGIKVLTREGLLPLGRVTPLANALRRRQTPRWILLIAVPKRYVARIGEVWRRVLFE